MRCWTFWIEVLGPPGKIQQVNTLKKKTWTRFKTKTSRNFRPKNLKTTTKKNNEIWGTSHFAASGSTATAISETSSSVSSSILRPLWSQLPLLFFATLRRSDSGRQWWFRKVFNTTWQIQRLKSNGTQKLKWMVDTYGRKSVAPQVPLQIDRCRYRMIQM